MKIYFPESFCWTFGPFVWFSGWRLMWGVHVQMRSFDSISEKSWWVNELHYWKLKINYFVRTSLNFESWSRKQPILIMKVKAWSANIRVYLSFQRTDACAHACRRAWHVRMLIPFWLVRWNIEMLLIGTKRTCHVPLRTRMLCRCWHRRRCMCLMEN